MSFNSKKLELKFYDELKAEMEVIQPKMVQVKKSERANALKEAERLCPV